MKQKIKTINNKRLVKADNPSELGKDELLVAVDNTTGKISLFEKDATGKVNQVAGGGGSDDGPLPGSEGMEDVCYIYVPSSSLSSYTPYTSEIKDEELLAVNLSGVEDGSEIELNVPSTSHYQDLIGILPCHPNTDIQIAKDCYIKTYFSDDYDGDVAVTAPAEVFSADTSENYKIIVEVRTPIKKHVVTFVRGYCSITGHYLSLLFKSK